MSTVLQWLVFISFIILNIGKSWAQSEGQVEDKLKKLSCLITTDFYIVHFTAYQEPRAPSGKLDSNLAFRPYCQEVPATGETYLTVDFIDRDVRTRPVALRVIEEAVDAESETHKEVRTLLEVPSKVYKTGVVKAKANFDKPGHYAVLVAIGEEAMTDDSIVRIPMRVAMTSQALKARIILPLSALVLGIATAGYAAHRYFRKKNLRAGV